jgi:hypothetical protein
LPRGARVAIDGYNVLFTLVNYRAGHPLFIATDGLLRDAGGAHGRIANDGLFAESVAMMAGRLASLGVSEATVFLDSPVPGSAGHAALIREAFGAVSVPVDAALVRCADGPVSSFIGDAAASSDSEIAADSLSPIFDLARDVLESAYAARFPDISSFIV